MTLLEAELMNDRKWIRVRDVYEVTKKPRSLDVSQFKVVPFYPMDAIPQSGEFEPRFWLDKEPGLITSGTYFERGDILVSKITPSFENGKQAMPENMATPVGYATTEVIPLHAKSQQQDKRLLFFYLLHPDIRSFVAERMEGTTGRQRVPEDVLLDLPFPEIPIDQQKIIADSLFLVQRSLELEQKRLDKCLVLKRAALRDLFTLGLRGGPSVETEVGRTPEHWKMEPLGQNTDITYGAQAAVANATDPNIGTLILTNVNITFEGRIDLEKKRYYKIPDHQRDRLALRRGDVLFNWRSGSADHVGKTAYFDLDGEFTYSSFILRFRPFQSISSKFLYRYLSHLRAWGFFTSQRNVSSINSVFNASLSATIPIYFPEAKEQQEIVEILDAIDCKIDLHSQKYALLQNLFKALLHKLITGEIMVEDLDSSAIHAGVSNE